MLAQWLWRGSVVSGAMKISSVGTTEKDDGGRCYTEAGRACIDIDDA